MSQLLERLVEIVDDRSLPAVTRGRAIEDILRYGLAPGVPSIVPHSRLTKNSIYRVLYAYRISEISGEKDISLAMGKFLYSLRDHPARLTWAVKEAHKRGLNRGRYCVCQLQLQKLREEAMALSEEELERPVDNPCLPPPPRLTPRENAKCFNGHSIVARDDLRIALTTARGWRWECKKCAQERNQRYKWRKKIKQANSQNQKP